MTWEIEDRWLRDECMDTLELEILGQLDKGAGHTFTADDVLDNVLFPPWFDLRALGPLLNSFRSDGLIRPTGQYKQSRIKRRHKRPVTEWVVL